jgi:hypothetical protein
MTDADDIGETDGFDDVTPAESDDQQADAPDCVRESVRYSDNGSMAIGDGIEDWDRVPDVSPGGVLIFDGFITGKNAIVYGPRLDGRQWDPDQLAGAESGDEVIAPESEHPDAGDDADSPDEPTGTSIGDGIADDEVGTADADGDRSTPDDVTEADPVADVGDEVSDMTADDAAQEADDDPN